MNNPVTTRRVDLASLFTEAETDRMADICLDGVTAEGARPPYDHLRAQIKSEVLEPTWPRIAPQIPGYTIDDVLARIWTALAAALFEVVGTPKTQEKANG